MIPLVPGAPSLSSSVQSTLEKNGLSEDSSRSPELLHEYLKSKKDHSPTCLEGGKRHSASSICKMPEQDPNANKKILKNQELKKPLFAPKGQPHRKQSRKAENPTRLPVAADGAVLKCSNSLTCQNSACRAALSIDDAYCKRCSCCICHSFDDNKDPSLWLECTSESGKGDFCGLSCHIECAFQRQKVGVVDLGQLMQLDGSYCCASCGKVSGILGSWKKQLKIAKDARRVDILCFRINMSYRLLDGTSRFKDLHDIVKEIKVKLDTELGPEGGVSTKMARGIVSRLSVAGDVQALCSSAIKKADERLAAVSRANLNFTEGSLPAACKVIFEEISTTSVVILLIEMSTSPIKDIKGYKLWYCKTREETHSDEPAYVFPRSQRRVLISNLIPCTEYSFRIVSYTETGDVGHSEIKCFTKSVEIIRKKPISVALDYKKHNFQVGASIDAETECKAAADVESDSSFQVRDLGKIRQLAVAKEQGYNSGLVGVTTESCGLGEEVMRCVQDQPVSRDLDLNVASVPDLNEELAPPDEFFRGEDVIYPVGRVDADGDVCCGNHIRDGLKSNGSGDSQNWIHRPSERKFSTVDTKGKMSRKRVGSTHEESHDCDSTLINGSPTRLHAGSGTLDEKFEYCVKMIRWLEREGYVKQDFRLKFLTWFSLRSTEQERRVVNTFIQTLVDDPRSLAGQLMDSFSDVVSSKRSRNGFCSKLWH